MRLVRQAIEEGGGTEIPTGGDAFFAVFPLGPRGRARRVIT